jgi:hypothetical protein
MSIARRKDWMASEEASPFMQLKSCSRFECFDAIDETESDHRLPSEATHNECEQLPWIAFASDFNGQYCNDMKIVGLSGTFVRQQWRSFS